jgi:ABC-type glycerol-3-phosphate transport system substrate-binding protein
MFKKRVSRRQLLRLSSLVGAGALVAACQPKIVEVEKIVRETVEVEKEVEKVVEKEVEKEVEKIVTPTMRPRAAGETVVLRYGTFWPMWRIEYMNQGLNIFHSENPDIRVSIEMGGGVYRDKLTTQYAAGTEADTGITDTYAMQRFYDEGLVLDMMPAFEKAGIDVREEYAVLGHEFRGDRLYGVPWVTFSHGIYYNKTMFREFGVPDPNDDLGGYWSMADFEQALAQIKESAPEMVFPLDLNVVSVDYALPEFIYGQCGRLYDFQNMKYTLSESNTIAALEKIMAWYDEGLLIDTESREATSLAGMLDVFSGQAVAMSKQSTGWLGQTLERVVDSFDWDLARCPTQTGASDETMSYVSADTNYASARTPYREEASEFLLFCAGEEMQNILSKGRVGMAARKASLGIDGGFLTPPPANVAMMLEPWENKRFVPRLLHHNALECTRIPAREMDYVLMGEKTVQEACETMDADMNALIEYVHPFVPASQWRIDFPDSVAACK